MPGRGQGRASRSTLPDVLVGRVSTTARRGTSAAGSGDGTSAGTSSGSGTSGSSSGSGSGTSGSSGTGSSASTDSTLRDGTYTGTAVTTRFGNVQVRITIAGGKLTDEMRAEILKGIPLNRLGDAEDVANIYLFLASDLSSYVTGAVIDVNGGMLIH